jgi:hypothetical protein
MNDENVKPFELKENITVEGVTENFIWYEAEQLRSAMNSWAWRFDKLVKTMEARHKENNLILGQLMDERQKLKDEIAQLKGEAK